MDPNRSPDLARTTLQLLALAALIGTSLWIVRPFLVALIWAATVAIATWPLLLHAQSWFGGRRSLAVALMTVVLLLILVCHCTSQLRRSRGTSGRSRNGRNRWPRSFGPSRPPGSRRCRWLARDSQRVGGNSRPRVRTRSRRISRPLLVQSPSGSSATWATLGCCWCSSCSPR